ncbi:trigger factor [Bacteroidota bacterium]
MNVIKENIDELNAILKVKVTKEDYEEKVINVLKDYRKKARIPGFRTGKVPFGMISKMYRTSVLVDEVNKIVSQSVSKYLVEEQVNILGEPLPSETDQEPIDWENHEEFNFIFDIGLTPDIEVTLTARDKLKYHNIKIDERILEDYLNNYRKRFGTFQSVDEIIDNEVVKGKILQLNPEGKILTEGIKNEESTISLEICKDDEIKNKFKGKKKGDKIIFDLKKAYPNVQEVANILRVDKEIAEFVGGNFELTIHEITTFVDAELNQDLFNKVYGDDVVKSKDGFIDKIKEEIALNFKSESEYKLTIDSKDLMMKKVKIDLPTEFLKRWLKAANKDKISDEDFEKEYPNFELDLKWQLIKNKIIKENEIKVEEDEIIDLAKKLTKAQFVQYGMNNVPDENITSYAENLLKKEEDRNRLYEQKMEEKVIQFIRDNVKLEEKEVSVSDFQKLFE